jgi:phytanoyl-CoA hydroxylase
MSELYPGVVKNLNKIDPWFEDQLERGKQTELIAALLEQELEPASAAWFDRIPGESSGIKPHVDALSDRREGATLWIALERADRENGCLHYLKGSHRRKLPSQESLEQLLSDSESEVVAVEAEPGDAILHSSSTVHWSGANRSQRSRKAISYFYWVAASRRRRPQRSSRRSKP